MGFLRLCTQGTVAAIAALGLLGLPANASSPQPVSVSPFSGAGSTQAFVFTFSDASGWQDLNVVNVLINSVIDGPAGLLSCLQPHVGRHRWRFVPSR
ncbi:exported hypothetical protein [Candidatus Sulfopaludibacter sp. SbA4]|nr:exported hypothetical protein [Candidatus Sulfopaludibacter sp. SbA4]